MVGSAPWGRFRGSWVMLQTTGLLESDSMKEMRALSRMGLERSAAKVEGSVISSGVCLICNLSVLTPPFMFRLSRKEMGKDGIIAVNPGRVAHGTLSHRPVSEPQTLVAGDVLKGAPGYWTGLSSKSRHLGWGLLAQLSACVKAALYGFPDL